MADVKRTETAAQNRQAEIQETNGPMIYTLIGKAMAEIGAIGKDSTNEQQRYKFRGIDAVYNALNPVMAKYGLFIAPEILEHRREERTTTKTWNGEQKTTVLLYSIITVRYTVYAPDGSFIQTTVIGEGMDSGDKATNKAMSIAMKYAMFQLFMIPTEDLKDPDAESHEVTVQPPKFGTIPKAKVSTTAKVPDGQQIKQGAKPTPEPAIKAPDTTTVKGYLQNEIAFMSQRLGISDKREMGAKFESMRKALIESKKIPEVKSEDLTMDQAKNLIEAIYTTFLAEKRDPA